ncbi:MULTISPECIES: MFS transporter [unclassified Paenibacillus]|uniref:MFS transporter n=1 Tax=unclassified Paenibacillus TaxID=185978 RepID=UPI001AE9EACF|nr:MULTISPECIES: MFS transporter [unclassified Paenibacillus]MBP1156892.1 MFS family permease [Paenibacillus sp. PvP091]MBP1172369.1 MFS family permease [Paenibacillus sp. PvR098]MBP2438750.1 MFS family permease [Paenibacillus sp. PvP052]
MEQSEKKRRLLIIAVALGFILNPLNTTMISVAFSRLQEDFGLSFMDISWLISTYYLASAISQPVLGKLSDLFGRKRLFLLGLLLVTGSSILAPLSPGFHWLLGFRVIQAIGTSALFPSGMSIVRSVVTENQARALGILSVFSSTSAAFGPSIGGLLIHYGDWQAIFLINFPVILVSFFLAIKVMPADSKQKMTMKIDLWGIVLFSLLVFVWLFFLLSLSNGGNWWLLGVGLALGFCFYRFEIRQAQPFIDIHFLKNNMHVTLIYVQFVLVNIVFYSITFGIPMYLQNARHFDTQQAGLSMLFLSGFAVLITPIVARWLDNRGSEYPLLLGTLTVIAGMLLFMTVQDNSGLIWFFVALSFLGISTGINNLGLQTALYSFVSTEETGAASGLLMTSRYIGTILSSSLLGNVFGTEIATNELHSMALVCALIGGLMLILTIRLHRMNMQNPSGSQ